MSWYKVGGWLKENAGAGASLVGSLLTGNVPRAVAAGIALVSGATGTYDATKALEALQTDPATLLELKRLASADAQSIREHLRGMEELRLKDEQAAHTEQQQTIRSGDNAGDEYVRHTRPLMARQSWYATMIYIVGFESAKAFGYTSTGAAMELAMVLIAPAAAYLGFRTMDKWRGNK